MVILPLFGILFIVISIIRDSLVISESFAGQVLIEFQISPFSRGKLIVEYFGMS